MNRKEIYVDIKETLGLIPAIFKYLPDATLEEEWHLYKAIRLDQGPIPNKYRELIGLAIAAATGCRPGALMHTEMAKANGATEEEIEDALHFAKSCVGWNAYSCGAEINLEQWEHEMAQMGEHVHSLQADHLLHRMQAESLVQEKNKVLTVTGS